MCLASRCGIFAWMYAHRQYVASIAGNAIIFSGKDFVERVDGNSRLYKYDVIRSWICLFNRGCKLVFSLAISVNARVGWKRNKRQQWKASVNIERAQDACWDSKLVGFLYHKRTCICKLEKYLQCTRLIRSRLRSWEDRGFCHCAANKTTKPRSSLLKITVSE